MSSHTLQGPTLRAGSMFTGSVPQHAVREPYAAGCAARTPNGVRGDAMRLAVETDPLLGQIEPAGSLLGDALNALGAAAATQRLGPIDRHADSQWP